MKERIRRLLPRVAYPALYFVTFLSCFVLTFPYESVKDFVVTEFNSHAAASGEHDELRIEGLSGYWLSGVEVHGVHLLRAGTDTDKGLDEWRVERAVARVSLLPLLIGHKNVTFSMEAYGGTIEGTASDQGGTRSADVTITNVDLGNAKPLAGLIGLPATGRLSGTLKLEVPDGKMHKASGTLSITLEDASVGDGKAKLKGLIALPRVNVGTVTLVAEVQNGSLKLTKLSAGGKDVEVAGEGKIALRESLMESQADLNVRFKINDAFKTKTELATAVFGAPGKEKSSLFEMDPHVKQSKRADGFYGWAVHGPLTRLDFMPSSGGTPGATIQPGGLSHEPPNGLRSRELKDAKEPRDSKEPKDSKEEAQ